MVNPKLFYFYRIISRTDFTPPVDGVILYSSKYKVFIFNISPNICK